MGQKERHKQRSKHSYRYWKKRNKDTYKCPKCGRGLDSVDRFEVHHKDRDPTNGDPENLVALCRECHYDKHGWDSPESLEEWKRRVEEW